MKRFEIVMQPWGLVVVDASDSGTVRAIYAAPAVQDNAIAEERFRALVDQANAAEELEREVRRLGNELRDLGIAP